MKCDCTGVWRDWKSICSLTDRYARECNSFYEHFCYTGSLPDACVQEYMEGSVLFSPRSPRVKGGVAVVEQG
jgi:hypothetical protein